MKSVYPYSKIYDSKSQLEPKVAQANLVEQNANTIRQFGKLIEYCSTGNKFAVKACKDILARQNPTPEQAQNDRQYLESVIGVVEDFLNKMKAGTPV